MSQQPVTDSIPNSSNNDPASPASAATSPVLQTQTISHKRSAETLAVGGDSIADLIRKAKASRTAGAGGDRKAVEDTTTKATGTAIDAPMDESLESALTCPICAEYLYRPVAAISCLHTFCGSCLVPWLKRSSACPSCRSHVTSIKDDHRTGSLLEVYLRLHPENARSEEDKVTLDKIYKLGDVVNLAPREDYGDDNAEEEEEDEENEDEEEEYPQPVNRLMQPCLCCNPPDPNPYGFACEHPIPSAAAVLNAYDRYEDGVAHHRRCNACNASMPLREGMACESCSVNWCGMLFRCEVEGILKRFEDVVTPAAYGVFATVFNTFKTNRTELEIYERWTLDSELANADIVSRFKEWLLEVFPTTPYMPGVPVRNLSNDTLLCTLCFLNMMRTHHMDWWIYEKEKSGVIDPRAKCWYGKTCRTQFHNPAHAERLSHACQETPAAERGNNNPRRVQVLPPAPAPAPRIPDVRAAGPAFVAPVQAEAPAPGALDGEVVGGGPPAAVDAAQI